MATKGAGAEAMGVSRGAAGSLGRGGPAVKLQRPVLKGPQERKCYSRSRRIKQTEHTAPVRPGRVMVNIFATKIQGEGTMA